MATQAQINTLVKELNSIQASGPLFKMIQGLADGVFNESPVWAFMNANGRKPVVGGSHFNFDIMTAVGDAETITGAEVLDTAAIEDIKQGTLPRTMYVKSAVYTLMDVVKNRGGGESYLVDYVASRMEGARKAMTKTLTYHLYGNGSTDVKGTSISNAIYGLALAVETDPTAGNTYAGHTRSSSTGWLNNQYLDVTNEAGITISRIKELTQRCTHGTMSPNLGVCSDSAWRILWNQARAEGQILIDKEAAQIGFPENFKIGSVTFIADKYLTASTSGGELSADAKRIWLLNTKDGIGLLADPEYDMKVTEVMKPHNQLAFVQYILFSGQLAATNPRLNGVLFWS